MDYYRINSYKDENKIDIIYLFLGNYLHIIDITIKQLRKLIQENDFQYLENILTNTEVKEIQKQTTKLYILDENIFRDDTILEIKQKIKLASMVYEKDTTVEEMYLYTLTGKHVDAKEMFTSIANGELNIDGTKLSNELQNFATKKVDIDKIYTYEDFVKLGFEKNSIHTYASLGIQFVNETIPVSIFQFQKRNDIRSTVENNRILSEYNVIGNTIHLVYLNTGDINQDEVHTYYPSLVQYGVESNATYLLKRDEIQMSGMNQVDQNVVNKFRNIRELYNKSNAQGIGEQKIQSLSFIVKSLIIEKLPLETIFKGFNTSKEIPLIKFNPGKKKEYIYRLYSNERNKENILLPYVSKTILRRYMTETRGKNNKYITFFVSIDDSSIFNINLFENGDTEVVLEYKSTTNTYKSAEVLTKKNVNSIRATIEENLNVPEHYIFDTFENMSDTNVIIRNINFQFDYNFSGKIKKLTQKINEYSNDMNYVFNITHNSHVNLLLEYKRVSIYDEIVPKIIVDINNKLLSVKVNDVRNLYYMTTIPLFITGLINMVDENSKLEKSKIELIKDIDEENNLQQNYLLRFNDEENVDEMDNISEEERKEDVEGEKEEGEEEDIDDNVSLGLSVNSDASLFETNNNGINEESDDDDSDNDDDGDGDEHSIGLSVSSNRSKFDTKTSNSDQSEETLGLGVDSDNSVFGGGDKYSDYFQKRMKSYDPVLFEKNEELIKDDKLKYARYSKLCQKSNHRQPIILTAEEKSHIDKHHPGTYGDHFMKYSSNPENPYYYICPRYWCVEKNISIGSEDVFKNEKGEMVSKLCKDDDGEYGTIKVSDHKDFHRDKHDPNKYINFRPGLGKSCIPCCFKQAVKLTPEPKCMVETNLEVEKKQDNSVSDISSVENDIMRDDSPAISVKTVQLNYVKQADKFPLQKNQKGDISSGMKRFFHIHNKTIKDNFLRFGVENNRNQSFVACLSLLYNFERHKNDSDLTKLLNKVQTIKQFKKDLIKLIDLDTYVGLHNGDINAMFYDGSKEVNKKSINKYKNTKSFEAIGDRLDKSINSYERFIDHIKDENTIIDHRILWEASLLMFKKKYNLVVIEYDNTNDDIHLVCPVYNYMHQLDKFNIDKASFILVKQKEFYEPIIYFNKSKSVDIQYNHSPHDYLHRFLSNISALYRNTSFCGVQPSSNYSKQFYENTSNFVTSLLKNAGYEIIHQVVNNNLQNVGFIVSNDDKSVYLPVYPSAQVDNMTSIYLYDSAFQKFIRSYEDTKTAMNKIHKDTDSEIPSKIIKKGLFEGSVVGVFTASDDYIPCIKEDNKSNDTLQDHIEFQKGDNGEPVDPSFVNKKISEYDVTIMDNESDMGMLLLNQQLYNNFKTYAMTVLTFTEYMSEFSSLEKITNSYDIAYREKYVKVKNILKGVLSKHINFTMKKKTKQEYVKDSKVTENSNDITLPKQHLLNGSSNVTGYFDRLADELIRYKMHNKFFTVPKQYVMNTVTDYDLQDDEILTFQSFLQSHFLNQYTESSKYFNDNFNLANPQKTIMYSNEVFDDEIMKNVINTDKKYLIERPGFKN